MQQMVACTAIRQVALSNQHHHLVLDSTEHAQQRQSQVISSTPAHTTHTPADPLARLSIPEHNAGRHCRFLLQMFQFTQQKLHTSNFHHFNCGDKNTIPDNCITKATDRLETALSSPFDPSVHPLVHFLYSLELSIDSFTAHRHAATAMQPQPALPVSPKWSATRSPTCPGLV